MRLPNLRRRGRRARRKPKNLESEAKFGTSVVRARRSPRGLGEPVLGPVVSRLHQRPRHFIDGRCLCGGEQQLLEVLQIRDGLKRRL